MDKFLTFTVVGLSTAAIYAVIASGLVLTYTTTGVFNFAQGAIGMLAAFTYWQLRVQWHWSTPHLSPTTQVERPSSITVPRVPTASAPKLQLAAGSL